MNQPRRTIIKLSLIAAAAFVHVPSLYAEPQVDRAEVGVQVEKLLSIAEELSLDKKQEKAFWPLYDLYQQDLQRIGDKRLQLVKEMRGKRNSLTDAQATEIIRRALALEEQRLGAKRRHAARLLEKLPARIVARYLQLENRIQFQTDAQMAEKVPLIKE